MSGDRKQDVSSRRLGPGQKSTLDYEQRMRAELDEISVLWAELVIDGWAVAQAQRIRDICHALAGSAETFGHPHISRVAAIAEIRLDEVLASGAARPAGLEGLREVIEVLAAAALDVRGGQEVPGGSRDSGQAAAASLEPAPTDSAQASRPDDIAASEAPESAGSAATRTVYVVEDDRDLADHIVMQLALHGYDGRAVYDPADLEAAIQTSGGTPGALIMDIIFPGAETGGIDIINRFRSERITEAPVLFISASDSFATRLQITRAGGDGFFVKPLDIALLIERLEALIGEADPEPLRVLIVEDDDVFADLVCAVLAEAGIDARALLTPEDAINVILEYRPDLVLLDMYMPDVNGIELAQVLRQHESCCDLPIVFLSAETNPVKRAAALDVGVDDFLTKPVDHRYLISAVANRAARARALRGKVVRDSLTHLLVHDEIRSQLVSQLSTARRYSRPLAYAMIDIDRFKVINDTHGHMTGDHVLQGMASLLRRSFRRGDVLGRYGGEEFVVIMQDTTIDQAVLVIERLREEFARTSHRSTLDGAEFQATFSAGISAFPEFDTAADMQNHADRALYSAKDLGRNRVVVAQNEKPGTSS